MRRLLGMVVALTVASIGLVAPTAASPATSDSDLTPDELTLVEIVNIDERLEELTFTTPALAGPTKVRVLLPSGYGDDPTRRYPVLHLLHGGFGSHLDWTTMGDAAAITADAPLIVVMPDSGPGWGYVDWWNGGSGGPPMWETYHVDQLLPWIDGHYRTEARRDGRAVAGLSMGGYGALHYAARHPDLFTAAAAFSGAVDTNRPPVQILVQSNPFGGTFGPDAVYGPRPTQEVRWRGHNPWDLAENLSGMFLQLDTGNGLPGGPGGDTGDPIEAACWDMMTSLHQRLDALGIAHVWNDYGAGGHAWFYWQRDLRDFLPRLLERFASPVPPPAPFAHTSIDPTYSVWGWTVTLDRPTTEFSALRDAGPGGFTLTGSGAATVTTGPDHEPGSRHTVTVTDADGTRANEVAADEHGRLTVDVSLGPANPAQQYTVEGTAFALAQGAAPGTWPAVTATVAIGPATSAAAAPEALTPTTPSADVAPSTAIPATLPATGGPELPRAAVLLLVLAIAAAATVRAAGAAPHDRRPGSTADRNR